MLKPVGNWGEGDIWRITAGEFPSNSYICDIGDQKCILIDAGLDPHPIDVALQDLGLRPTYICCTHGHFDHVGSAAFFQERYGCSFYLHENDIRLMKSANFLLMAYRLSTRVSLPKQVHSVKSGDRISFGKEQILFHESPGHTDGSCIIQIGCALFTGDTIYARGVGLSNIPGERPEILRTSLQKNWHLLTKDRFVFPGHGSCANGQEVSTENKELLRFLAC